MFGLGTRNRPLIVGGFYRSGTTLLRRLLDAHPAIHCPPEIKFFRDFYGDYRGDGLAHLRFFSTARQMGLPEASLLKIYGRAYLESRRAAMRRANKRRWADKNPENAMYLEQWAELLGDRFVFVHVVRDPLDALASLDEIGFLKTVPTDFGERVELCRAFLDRAAAFAGRHPQRTRVLRYENLVRDPERTLGQLMKSIGERFESAWIAEAFRAARGTGIEDPKAAKATGIYRTSLGRWKQRLTDEQARLAASRLREPARLFGYDLSVP